MREILFRGKRVDNGEWVMGIYIPVRHRDDNSHIHTFIMPLEHCVDKSSSDLTQVLLEVDPETVGQYTGLTDKNGTKIFEGDIVRHYNKPGHLEFVSVGAIYYDADDCKFKRTAEIQFLGRDRYFHEHVTAMLSNVCIYEVIGNIHDNPELLGGGQE